MLVSSDMVSQVIRSSPRAHCIHGRGRISHGTTASSSAGAPCAFHASGTRRCCPSALERINVQSAPCAGLVDSLLDRLQTRGLPVVPYTIHPERVSSERSSHPYRLFSRRESRNLTSSGTNLARNLLSLRVNESTARGEGSADPACRSTQRKVTRATQLPSFDSIDDRRFPSPSSPLVSPHLRATSSTVICAPCPPWPSPGWPLFTLRQRHASSV